MGDKSSEKNVRWAILGAGKIAERFSRSLAHVPGAELVAASFRSSEKARAFARAHNLDPKRCYADDALGHAGAAHEALLASDDIDAVYLALPHDLHHRWAVEALEAHRAVLCEKPAMLSAEEMEDVARVATEQGTLFMEAMKTRFVPIYPQLKALLEHGAIGEVLRVETSLMNDMGDRIPSRVDYMSDRVCGGVLYDTGIYCASWLEDFLPATPQLTALELREDQTTGVDTYVDAELLFGVTTTARLTCATDAPGPKAARIVGTRGTLEVDQLHRPERAVSFSPDGKSQTVEVLYEVDDFYGELAHFTELVRSGQKESPVMPLSASIRCAQIIDAIRKPFSAGRERGPEQPAWKTRVLCANGRRDPSRF